MEIKTFSNMLGTFTSASECRVPACTEPGWDRLTNYCVEHYRIIVLQPIQAKLDSMWELYFSVEFHASELDISQAMREIQAIDNDPSMQIERAMTPDSDIRHERATSSDSDIHRERASTNDSNRQDERATAHELSTRMRQRLT